MKAVQLYGVGDLRVDDVAEPADPAAAEVLVQVDAAGICGSDLHNFRTGQWISRAPTVPGHEFCGTIRAAGSQSGLRAGDRVVADSRVFCGSCDSCQRGRPHLCRAIGYVGEVCDGGFAPLVRLPGSQILALPDQNVDPLAAAMAEPLAVAAHTVNRLAPEAGGPVAIAGAGAIGALAALLLSHRGLGPVFVADRNAARLKLVTDVCGARPADLADLAGSIGAQPDLAIEATGSAAVAASLLGQMAPGGRVASVGIFHGLTQMDMNQIVEGEIDWLGCASFHDELKHVLPLLTPLTPQLRLLAGAPIGIDEVPAAYRALIDGKLATIKTLVTPN